MNAVARLGLLGDTPERDYRRKLELFNAFAEPEIRRLIAELNLQPGARVLDAGCGTGEAMSWLADAVQPEGHVVGIDLAAAHVTAARARREIGVDVVQANLKRIPLRRGTVDLIWSVNTVNHLREPLDGLRSLAELLAPDGRVALGQSSFLADMYFAWDARLEQRVNEAVRRYYRERYRLDERDLTSIRALVGLARRAGFVDVRPKTILIERVAPLANVDRDYLVEAIFEATWGERLRPYLSAEDFAELARLCDPKSADFALRRDDFHFLQSFTLVTARIGRQ